MSEEINIPQENSKNQIPNLSADRQYPQKKEDKNISPSTAEGLPKALHPESQTENMEVHKHPHHVTHKKKWGEYLLEFLMIFLAVTLGFFAENIRENISDKRRIHDYMQSMVNDLKNDLVLYHQSTTFNYGRANLIDSIITSISQHKNNTQEIYYAARQLTKDPMVVTPDSKTFEQMKNSN